MNNESMEALFSGLTGTPTEKPVDTGKSLRQKRTTRKGKLGGTAEERFCTIVNSNLLHKIRLIASREGLQIKDVVNAAFEKAVKSYERRHGVVEGDVKGNIENLF